MRNTIDRKCLTVICAISISAPLQHHVLHLDYVEQSEPVNLLKYWLEFTNLQ